MADKSISAALSLGEPADEADWRAQVDKGLKGAGWEKLTGKTADGIDLKPLYREPDLATATDVSGPPGVAPFIRGAAGWTIRQSFDHADPEHANKAILADLQGGVGAIELVIDPSGAAGVAIRGGVDLDIALANVVLEAAPVSLDAGADGLWAADLLAAKLRGVASPGTAFNVDPIGTLMRTGATARADIADAARFATKARATMPAARALRVDARPVHEAGGTEAQEIAAALSTGIAYLRALGEVGVSPTDAAQTMEFTVAIGPDVLVETAKVRALRLTWARVLEASGVEAVHRGARIHAVTSRRMMTRYDSHTNILRVTTAAFAAVIGGAQAVTTLPFSDAIGRPTPFARRVARNTQLVLMEESRLGHVADPAGGAWFVEKLTRDLADIAWRKMQTIEAAGGIVAALTTGTLQQDVSAACAKREAAFARRKEAITGVTDFPLLGVALPAVDAGAAIPAKAAPKRATRDVKATPLAPIRWAAPFEELRASAEARGAKVFFANMGALAEFTPRANFARNAFAAGGVDAIGPESHHATMETLVAAFRQSGVRVAVITGTDACYAEHAQHAARALKDAGSDWLVLAGKPGEAEASLRAAGVDQFVFVGQDMVAELKTLHAALGVGP
ncbi:methylmalonyl-CoA mutase [alpha proteobacterium U9-1i]|nr:methylmalonyl-CoA mutase [alpha proteobacterium U9-1i]